MKIEERELRPCLVLKKWSLITQFSSPITHHSVFITHHSSLKTPHPTPFGTITHLSSLNIFQLFVGHIPVLCAAFTLFSFFFLQPLIPKLTEPSEKKNNNKNKNQTHRTQKKKKRGRIEDQTVKKKREREEELKTK